MSGSRLYVDLTLAELRETCALFMPEDVASKAVPALADHIEELEAEVIKLRVAMEPVADAISKAAESIPGDPGAGYVHLCFHPSIGIRFLEAFDDD